MAFCPDGYVFADERCIPLSIPSNKPTDGKCPDDVLKAVAVSGLLTRVLLSTSALCNFDWPCVNDEYECEYSPADSQGMCPLGYMQTGNNRCTSVATSEHEMAPSTSSSTEHLRSFCPRLSERGSSLDNLIENNAPMALGPCAGLLVSEIAAADRLKECWVPAFVPGYGLPDSGREMLGDCIAGMTAQECEAQGVIDMTLNEKLQLQASLQA